MVGWFDLESIANGQGMNHSIESFLVFHYFRLPIFFAMCTSKHKHIYSVLVQDEEVVGGKQKAFDWRLPKLVSLVPITKLIRININDNDIVGVDAD